MNVANHMSSTDPLHRRLGELRLWNKGSENATTSAENTIDLSGLARAFVGVYGVLFLVFITGRHMRRRGLG